MDEQLTDDESQPLPKDKAELLERIQLGRAALEATIGRLSDEQLVEPGPPDGWSVKDHLFHVAAWERSLPALLQGRPRYAAMNVDEKTYVRSEEALNALIFQHNKGRSLSEALADFEQAHQDLLGVLAGLTDADLFRTYSQYQPDEPGEDSGAPIVGWIAGNSYEHYAEHQAWVEVLAG